MRLTFVISSLTCGGAQRVMSIIANEFSRRGFRVSILTLNGDAESFYHLEPDVRHIPLDLYGTHESIVAKVAANVDRLRTLRRAIKHSEPDVVLSFGDATNVLTLSCGFRGAPIVVSERINPDHWDIGPIWSGLRDVVYRFAERIVVQASDIKTIAERWGRPVSIIQNPIEIEKFPTWRGGTERVVAAGRLVPQKGFDFLIDAFALAAKDRRTWSLDIYGDGPLEGELKQRADEVGLSDRVTIHPSTPNIFEVFSTSEMFVLSSRFEGFPNVLIEAMACALPCVAYDCPSGPRDIIARDVENGTLVTPMGDVEQLAAGIARYMDDATLRREVGEAARESIQTLDVGKNIVLWMDALGIT